jgi:hypothetical protein
MTHTTHRFLLASFAALGVSLGGCKPSTSSDAPQTRVEVVVMPATYAAHSDATPAGSVAA